LIFGHSLFLFIKRMKKDLIKMLVKEVLQELEASPFSVREADTDQPSDSPMGEKEPQDPSPDTMKHAIGAEKHQGDVEMILTLKGVKPGKAYKKAMAMLAHQAKMADLEVIHAEIERAGKPIETMDAEELKANAPTPEEPVKKQGGLPSVNMQNFTDEERAEWLDPNTSLERKKALYRLSKIAPGEKSAEWKSATEKDVVDAREKERLKKAKIAAGTYDPSDTSLWTDKEWDAYNQDSGDVQTYGAETGLKSAGKYKPGLSKATGRKMPKVHIGTLRNQ
jgi:hypothetical protein